MKLIFGMSLDEQPLPMPAADSGGLLHCGPQGLLQTLESQLGLAGQPKDNDYLRIEEYRQALRLYLEAATGSLLSPAPLPPINLLRPQIYCSAATSCCSPAGLSSWQLDTPPRLRAIAEVEHCFTDQAPDALSPGFADRFHLVHQKLEPASHHSNGH